MNDPAASRGVSIAFAPFDKLRPNGF